MRALPSARRSRFRHRVSIHGPLLLRLCVSVVGSNLLRGRGERRNHIQTLTALGEQGGRAVAARAIKAAYGGHSLRRFRWLAFELAQDVHVAAQLR